MLPYAWVMFTRVDLVLPLHHFIPAVPYSVAAYFTLSRAAALIFRSFSGVLIIAAAFQRLSGVPVQRGEWLRVSVASLLPVTAISLCQWAGIIVGDAVLRMPSQDTHGWFMAAFGAALFMLPGLALQIVWFAAPAICVIERLGAIASLRRSFVLTRGQRGKIFAAFIVFAIPSVAAGAIDNLVFGATRSKALYAVLQYGTQGVYVALSTLLGLVVYNSLRAMKSRTAPDRIAAVFE